MSGQYSVEEACEQLEVTARTLHYYEEIGLIPAVARTEGGHRVYDEAALTRLKHILRIRNHLGASLQEIRAILEAEEKLGELKATYRQAEADGEKADILDRSRDLLEQMVGRIDERIEKLQAMRSGFAERLDRVKKLRK